jgi:hypothetical protein
MTWPCQLSLQIGPPLISQLDHQPSHFRVLASGLIPIASEVAQDSYADQLLRTCPVTSTIHNVIPLTQVDARVDNRQLRADDLRRTRPSGQPNDGDCQAPEYAEGDRDEEEPTDYRDELSQITVTLRS